MKYLLVVRSSMNGPLVQSWHEIDEANPAETKTVMFGMLLSSRSNGASGILAINSDDELDPDSVQDFLRLKTPAELTEWINGAKV